MGILKLRLNRAMTWTNQNVQNLGQCVHPHNAIVGVGALDYNAFPSLDAALWNNLLLAGFPATANLPGSSPSGGAFSLLGLDAQSNPVNVGFRVLRAVHRLTYVAQMLYRANGRLDLLGNGVFDTDSTGGFNAVPEFAIEPSMASTYAYVGVEPLQVTLETLAALYANGQEVTTDNTSHRSRYFQSQAGTRSFTLVEMRGPNKTLPTTYAATRGLFSKSNPVYSAALVSNWNLITNSAVRTSAAYQTEWTIDVDDVFLTSLATSGSPVYAVFPLGVHECQMDYYSFGSGGDYIFSPTVTAPTPGLNLNGCIRLDSALAQPQGLSGQYSSAPADILLYDAITGGPIANSPDINLISNFGIRQNSGGDFDGNYFVY